MANNDGARRWKHPDSGKFVKQIFEYRRYNAKVDERDDVLIQAGLILQICGDAAETVGEAGTYLRSLPHDLAIVRSYEAESGAAHFSVLDTEADPDGREVFHVRIDPKTGKRSYEVFEDAASWQFRLILWRSLVQAEVVCR